MDLSISNREWARRPLSFFAVCPNPIHRVMENWDPPISQVIHLPCLVESKTETPIILNEIWVFTLILIL